MLDYFILAQDTIDPPKRKSWNRHCFQLQKLRLGFTRKKKKKKIHLSNIVVGYVRLITKMQLKTEFWKLKTPKMCF